MAVPPRTAIRPGATTLLSSRARRVRPDDAALDARSRGPRARAAGSTARPNAAIARWLGREENLS
nr:hypothetical protein GCM10020063_007900 [Dactylosporangium thailandense]